MNKLLDDLVRALDPVELAGQALGLKPAKWQKKILRSKSKRIIMLCARQSGKSTIAALKALHQALYKPGSLCLIVAPSERQSRELFRKAQTGYRSLGRPIVAESENRLSLELENGSRIVALPSTGATIRGFSGVDLLIEDEAAQVRDEDFFSVLPTIAASDGQLILLSTPAGRRGHFFETWENGGRQWERVRVPADEAPHLEGKVIKELRDSMGPYLARQELDVEFVENIESFFSYDEILAAFDPEIEPLFPRAG